MELQIRMTIQPLTNESVDVVVRRATHLLAGLEDRLPALGELYRDLHRHPELSMQEHRTAGIVAQHLRDSGYEVTEGIGKTGVVGLLRNGAGPVVMLRGDMDALPIKEQTGVDYTSDCVWGFGGHSRERYNAAPGDNLMAKMPYLPSNHQS